MAKQLRSLAGVFVVVLTLSQTACVVETQHPLSDPETATFDERLLGEWRGADGDGHFELYFIGKIEGAVGKAPTGLFGVHSVRVNTKAKAVASSESPLYGFSSKIGSSDFLNLVELKKTNDQPLAWESKEAKKYLPMKYAVEPNRLTVWNLDLEATAKEVEGGKLAGKVNRGMNKMIQSVFLTDSTEKLRAYLEKGGNKTIFNDKNKLVLERVKW